jgi:1,4-alpha-glucan branching enzyme
MKSFTDYDAWLFHTGKDTVAYQKMGAHLTNENGQDGTRFVVWAPHAQQVSVITSRNNWDPLAAPMQKTSEEVWELFIPGMQKYDSYKYVIVGADGVSRYKADPYAFWSEKRPSNSSVVWSLDSYQWHDQAYLDAVDPNTVRSKPMSIYEVHLGSWKKDYRLNEDGFLNYGRLADELVNYVTYMGFTHVELMGICEYPFDGSWGYQVSGYFSPTSRYGNPDDFKYFVDRMHQAGIGVILDWVPAHFPKDSYCLETFDGTPLYESADPLLAEYPEWGTKAFDYSKPQVRSFMMSSAFYWVNEFHVDALRVDAVAAMLFTSFSRSEWRPNIYGGDENLDSIEFLKLINNELRTRTKGYMIAEDSSIRAGMTEDVDKGGMGFMFKWNMGWMNNTLKYMKKDPVYRKYHHGELTHTADYVFTEYFVNVLSHDEVVHLKNSMLGKMPGSMGDKFAGLKTLYCYQWLHPGKKLLFMGQEFAQEREWSEARDIDWGCAEDVWHRDVMQCVRNLNALYKKYPCLYSDSLDPVTFEWVNRDDASRSTISFMRRNPWNWDGSLLCIINFTPVYLEGYSCGVPIDCSLQRVFSTYDSLPGGGELSAEVPPQHSWKGHCDHYEFGMTYNLRPFECVVFELK